MNEVAKEATKEVILPVVYRLPPELVEKIGHIIVAFSYIEFLLSRIIYDLLELGQVEGRLAIREPQANERVVIISDLIALRNLELETDLKALQSLVENIEKDRNAFAHGVWMRHPNTQQLFLRITKGSWRPNPKVPGKVKRVIKPEGREYSVEDATTLADQIDQTTAVILDLAKEIVNKIPTLREEYL